MVSAKQTFVIDTSFSFGKTAEAFHGAPLLVVDCTDRTFIYGFVRDLLRLRRMLGVRRDILVAVEVWR
jgi:hypothetical protein